MVGVYSYKCPVCGEVIESKHLFIDDKEEFPTFVFSVTKHIADHIADLSKEVQYFSSKEND